MNMDYKNFLPASLRGTRWGQFIEVIQDVFGDIKTDKIDIIKTQYIIDQMTEQQIIDMGAMFGYTINQTDGYSGTYDYIKKELLTLVPRIIHRTTRLGYLYTFRIYNLTGSVYPTYHNIEGAGNLVPIEDWWESNESVDIYETLDAGADFVLFRIPKRMGDFEKIDGSWTMGEYYEVARTPREAPLETTTLDTAEFPTLDMTPYLEYLTRHLIINYSFRFVEYEDKFMGDNTLYNLYRDIFDMKRATEIPYFEPVLEVNPKSDGSVTEENYINYNNTITGTVKSILIGSDLSDIATINFGSNSHSTIDSSITNVKQLNYSLSISDFAEEITTGASYFAGRRKITQKNTMINFKELALLDSGGNCVFYATFPEVRFYNKAYHNIYLKIMLTD